jgi:hypothetical protein
MAHSPAAGGHVFAVTATGYLVDHLGAVATRARNTLVPEPAGLVAAGGHHLYFTDRTGVGVIEDGG